MCVCVAFTYRLYLGLMPVFSPCIRTTLCWRGAPCLQLLCKFTKCKLHATKGFSLLSLSRLSDVVCVCLFVCVLVNGKLKNSIQSFLYSLQLLSHASLNQQLFIYCVCVFLSLSLALFSSFCSSAFLIWPIVHPSSGTMGKKNLNHAACHRHRRRRCPEGNLKTSSLCTC